MKKKRKTRKLGLVAKQMMMIGLVVWVSIAIIIAIVTITRRNDMVELAGEECIAVSTLLSSYVDADDVAAAGNDEDIYNALKAQLAQAIDDANMEYVYTLWTDGSTIFYGIDGNIDDPAEYGEESENVKTLLPVLATLAIMLLPSLMN